MGMPSQKITRPKLELTHAATGGENFWLHSWHIEGILELCRLWPPGKEDEWSLHCTSACQK